MIELGVLFFGAITGNLVLSVGWCLLNIFNVVPTEYELISVASLIIISIIRKIFKSSASV